jgi:hypothetical protein
VTIEPIEIVDVAPATRAMSRPVRPHSHGWVSAATWMVLGTTTLNRMGSLPLGSGGRMRTASKSRAVFSGPQYGGRLSPVNALRYVSVHGLRQAESARRDAGWRVSNTASPKVGSTRRPSSSSRYAEMANLPADLPAAVDLGSSVQRLVRWSRLLRQPQRLESGLRIRRRRRGRFAVLNFDQ